MACRQDPGQGTNQPSVLIPIRDLPHDLPKHGPIPQLALFRYCSRAFAPVSRTFSSTLTALARSRALGIVGRIEFLEPPRGLGHATDAGPG